MVNNGVTENRIALRKDNAPTGPTIRVDGLVQAYNKGEVTMEMASRLVMNLFRHEESKNVHVPYVTEFTEDARDLGSRGCWFESNHSDLEHDER